MRPGLTCAAAAVLLLLGCTRAAVPAAEPTADPVLEARSALGEPMVELAEAVIALADGLEQARFDVGRGEDMRRAAGAVAKRRDAVAEAQQAAATAAAQAPVQEAADIVAEAAAATKAALPAADAELRYLRQITEVDAALFDVAAAWDEPGSQSEIRERLLDVAADVVALRGPARRLDPSPRDCTAMRRNRLDWITTVRTRTLALQEQANSFGGSTFDKLRTSYRALPFAVEPRTADRTDRTCWLEESEVVATAGDVRGAVEELRQALSR